MSHIRSKNTKPEVALRRALWSRGFRYRVNVKDMPGSPDIVLAKYRSAVFVHGCFWHGHKGCKISHIPQTNTEFWRSKIKRNQDRDQEVWRQLEAKGWFVLIVWECELMKANLNNTVEEAVVALAPAEGAKVLNDEQGNRLNPDGSYAIDTISSIDDLTDEDFINPSRTVQLPTIAENLAKALNIVGEPVIIKKNVFGKNRDGHPELTPEMSRDVLARALYAPNQYANVKPISRPDYRVAIQTGEKNAIVILDIFQNNDNVEIVGWRQIDEDGFNKMKKQARKEGGQFLILSPIDGSAADLPALQSGLFSESKDSEKSEETSVSGKNSGELTETQKQAMEFAGVESPQTAEQSRRIIDLVRENVEDKDAWGDMFEYELQSTLGYDTLGGHVLGGMDYFLGNLYNYETDEDPGAERNSKLLRSIGIVGMVHPAHGVNGEELEDEPNVVIYDENDLTIVEHLRFSKVTDKAEIDRLEKEPYTTLYRAMEKVGEGEYIPVMSQKIPNAKGERGKKLERRNPEQKGFWYRSDEDPGKAYQKKDGGAYYYDLKKSAQGQSDVREHSLSTTSSRPLLSARTSSSSSSAFH